MVFEFIVRRSLETCNGVYSTPAKVVSAVQRPLEY